MLAPSARRVGSPASGARRPRSAFRWLVWSCLVLLGVAMVLYAIICAFMALTLTRPDRRNAFSHFPESFGLAYDSVAFPSRIDAIQLRGWLLHPPNEVQPHPRPVIMIHGKGADREGGPGEGILAVAAPLVRNGYTVLTFDLRASGESGGERFTLGAQEVRDVGGAIDFVRTDGLAPEGVDLLGFSMGASTALLTAAHEPTVRAVVEDSGYADLVDLLHEQVPRASGLPDFFTPGMVFAANALLGVDLYAIRPVDGVPALAAAGVPLLVIHGAADTYVPPINAQRLAAAYGPGVETLLVPGAGHVEAHLTAPALYDERVLDFLKKSESWPRSSADK